MTEEPTGPGGEGGSAPQLNEDQVADDFARTRGIVWLARFWLLIAVGAAGYLVAVSLSAEPIAGCGPASGCNQVLSSRWAYWFGIPVSLPGGAIYLCLLAATAGFNRTRSQAMRHRSRQVITVLSVVILAAAGWFALVQLAVIGMWCKFCIATHASACLAACLLLHAAWRTRSGAFAPDARRAFTLGVFAAAIGLTLLVAGQVMMRKQFYKVSALFNRAGSRPGQISLHDGRFTLNAAELPHTGSPSATNFIVCLFDYTCTHCRALHPLLTAAEQKYPGRLGVVSLPVPLDAGCNPLIIVTAPANNNACAYAKLSLALWHVRPDAFRIFDDWLFDSRALPPLDEARAKAEALVGRETVDRALADPWVERQLQTDIAIYQANSRVTGDLHLPQIVIGKVVIRGAMDNLDDLLRLIRQHTRLD